MGLIGVEGLGALGFTGLTAPRLEELKGFHRPRSNLGTKRVPFLASRGL